MTEREKAILYNGIMIGEIIGSKEPDPARRQKLLASLLETLHPAMLGLVETMNEPAGEIEQVLTPWRDANKRQK